MSGLSHYTARAIAKEQFGEIKVSREAVILISAIESVLVDHEIVVLTELGAKEEKKQISIDHIAEIVEKDPIISALFNGKIVNLTR